MKCPLYESSTSIYQWKKFRTVDMTIPISLTDDIVFSENNRSWYVDVLSTAHNGMYVCQIEKSEAVEEYTDTTNFYISISGNLKHDMHCYTINVIYVSFHAEHIFISIIITSSFSGCPYHAPDISIQIQEVDKIAYEEGSKVVFTCTAVAVEEHEQPYWWVEQNSIFTICTSPVYIINSSFEKLACKWTSILTIINFNEDHTGNYYCGFGSYTQNKTLFLESKNDVLRKFINCDLTISHCRRKWNIYVI